MNLSSLRARLLLLVLLGALPALALVLYSAGTERRLVQAQAEREALRLARLGASTQERFLESARGLLTALGETDVVRRQRGAECTALFRKIMAARPAFINLGGVTSGGRVFCSALPTAADVRLDDRPYVQRALATRTFAVGDYQVGRITRRPSVNAGYPVLGPDGRVEAVLFAALDLTALSRVFEEISLPPGATVLVADARGTSLVAYPDPERWVGRNIHEMLPGLRPTQGATEGVRESTGPDSTPQFVAFARLNHSMGGATPIVAIVVPRAAVFSEANRMFGRSLILLGAVVVLAIAAAWIFGELLIRRRLRTLARTAERLGAGDLRARTGLAANTDELGALARSFDEMADALELHSRRQAHLESQLSQAQTMEALGQLSAGVAYDFRNTLSVILANVELARAAMPADRQDLASCLQDIDGAARGATAMVQRLLGFSRQADLDLQPVRLADAIQICADTLRPMLPPTVRLRIEPDPSRTVVQADATAIQHVLLNIATNARDAMPEGGELTMRSEQVTLGDDAKAIRPWLRPGDYCRVSITDTGTGMDENTVARIFDPLFTTKPPGQGTGLGMAMVYGLMKRHWGFVHVYSEPGRGTTVTVYFPVSAERAAVAPARAPLAQLPRGTETVLVVDDDETPRRSAQRILAKLGYRVLLAADGVEALATFRAHRNQIDLVVSDVMMPRMDGIQLYHALAAEDSGLIFLFSSGYADQSGTPFGVARVPFLQKPWTIGEVATKVREVLDAAAPRRQAASVAGSRSA